MQEYLSLLLNPTQIPLPFPPAPVPQFPGGHPANFLGVAADEAKVPFQILQAIGPAVLAMLVSLIVLAEVPRFHYFVQQEFPVFLPGLTHQKVSIHPQGLLHHIYQAPTKRFIRNDTSIAIASRRCYSEE